MGALTLKSFPFELRGWDIEKFDSIDPTDSFGSNTRVYVSKDQVVLIEPDYDSNSFNTWLSDKGRQFFDGMFNSWNSETNYLNKISSKNDFWVNIFTKILNSVYIFDHCNKQNIEKKYFTIVFENLSIEVLTLLLILEKNYSFIKLRRAENIQLENDFENDFLLSPSQNKLKYSTLCLLISSNPRYEGYYLNLKLRQRFLKGNFKCLTIGSLTDLSFPISFLGSNLNILKSITEGNSVICQDLKIAKNPLFIYNNEMFKRNDGNNILLMLKNLNSYSSKFMAKWNGLNMLSSSLSENGTHLLTKFKTFNSNDLENFSNLYFINVASNNVPNLKKITELKLLNYSKNKKNLNNNKLVLDQNYKLNNNYTFLRSLDSNSSTNSNFYQYLPSSVFYENEETFLNTEGFFKRTVKLISKKKTRNNWQILRKILKNLKKKFISLDQKNNNLLYFNSNKLINFKNFIYFNFYATQSLDSLNFYLTSKTSPVFFYNNFLTFKPSAKKIQLTKNKYWLDDFFTNSKDEYSQNSLILSNCSKIVRSESTNFF